MEGTSPRRLLAGRHRILLVRKQLGDPACRRRADGYFNLVGLDHDNLLGRTSVGDFYHVSSVPSLD